MRKVILSMQMTLDGFPLDQTLKWIIFLPSQTGIMWNDLHQEMWKNLEAADTFILGK